jgi:hypothetical protein
MVIPDLVDPFREVREGGAVGGIDHPDRKVPDGFERCEETPEGAVVGIENIGAEIRRDLGEDRSPYSRMPLTGK